MPGMESSTAGPAPNADSYSHVVMALVRSNDLLGAVACLRRARDRGFRVREDAYSSLVLKLGRANDFERVDEISKWNGEDLSLRVAQDLSLLRKGPFYLLQQ